MCDGTIVLPIHLVLPHNQIIARDLFCNKTSKITMEQNCQKLFSNSVAHVIVINTEQFLSVSQILTLTHNSTIGDGTIVLPIDLVVLYNPQTVIDFFAITKRTTEKNCLQSHSNLLIHEIIVDNYRKLLPCCPPQPAPQSLTLRQSTDS